MFVPLSSKGIIVLSGVIEENCSVVFQRASPSQQLCRTTEETTKTWTRIAYLQGREPNVGLLNMKQGTEHSVVTFKLQNSEFCVWKSVCLGDWSRMPHSNDCSLFVNTIAYAPLQVRCLQCEYLCVCLNGAQFYWTVRRADMYHCLT